MAKIKFIATALPEIKHKKGEYIYHMDDLLFRVFEVDETTGRVKFVCDTRDLHRPAGNLLGHNTFFTKHRREDHVETIIYYSREHDYAAFEDVPAEHILAELQIVDWKRSE